MECNCSCDYYSDDEYPDIYESKFRKARKSHVCMECNKEIKPGEKYEYFKCLFEGDWTDGKTCKQCVAIREDYGCNTPHGMLREEIWDCLGVDIITGEIQERDY